MFKSKLAGFIMLLTVSILSCRKDSVSNRGDSKLVIKLENTLVAVTDIDSANVVLRKGANGTPYFFRFDKGTNKLEALVEGLANGEWTADIELYTKKLQSGKSYQFVANRAVTITSNAGEIITNGPSDLGPDGWSSRWVHATTDNDIVVLIPLDVNDPYFEIRTKGLNWDYFSVERTAVNGSAVVAYDQWTCDNDCPGNDRLIFNKEHFKLFTDEIKQNTWTRNDITITVGNVAQMVYHDFTNTWTD